jgi:hypothetical protein
MSSNNMPLSPAPSHSGEIYQHGLQHIIHHNANSPYPSEQYQNDEGVHLQSDYRPPTLGNDDAHGYRGRQLRFAYQQHQHQGSGLGIQYVSGMRSSLKATY